MSRSFLTKASLVVAVSLPIAASAECFDKSDMGRGLTVTFSNENTVIMRRTNTGEIAIIEGYAGEPVATRFTGPHGLYFREEISVEAGRDDPESRITIDFGTAGFPPPPTLGLKWSNPTTNIFPDGNTRDEIYSVTVDQALTYDLSGCTYDALLVNVRYAWPGENDGFGLQYAYLPAIDSAFLLSSAVDDNSIPPNIPISLTRADK